MGEVAAVPDHAEEGVRQLGAAWTDGLTDGVDVGGVYFRVTDDTDMLDGFDLLGGEAEEAGLEIAGDTVIRDRVLQTTAKKRIIQPVATGTEAVHEGRLKAEEGIRKSALICER